MTNTESKQLREELKTMFPTEASICKKCTHNQWDHYWNGAGGAGSGYDSCKICGCVDYDEKKDFEIKIVGYQDEIIAKLLSLFHSHESQIKQDIFKKVEENVIGADEGFRTLTWNNDIGKADGTTICSDPIQEGRNHLRAELRASLKALEEKEIGK